MNLAVNGKPLWAKAGCLCDRTSCAESHEATSDRLLWRWARGEPALRTKHIASHYCMTAKKRLSRQRLAAFGLHT